jgi:predicted N-acetyltransferase YhbS
MVEQSPPPTTRPPFQRELDGGIIIRRATAADVEPIVALAREIFHRRAVAHLQMHLQEQVPDGRLEDVTVAEDTATGQLVSSLCLLGFEGRYAGISLGIGQPEFVQTHPSYRRRGLVRAQLEVAHHWSAQRGDLMQLISGIPNYYRQFGYDMALEKGLARSGFTSQAPELEDGQPDPYRFRVATETDVPFLAATAAGAARRYQVADALPTDYWAARLRMLQRVEPGDPHWRLLRIIEDATGAPVGYLAHWNTLVGHQISVTMYELVSGVSWLAVTPSVVRFLCAYGAEVGRRDGTACHMFGFEVGIGHPVHDSIPDLLPLARNNAAWYVRIPDLPAFLRHVAPALEERLAHSYAAGHTGELNVSFYCRGGVRLVFEQGHITAIEPWQAASDGRDGVADAAFPDLTFTQLVLGNRTVADLEHAYADCWHRTDTVHYLLTALFPRHPSQCFRRY